MSDSSPRPPRRPKPTDPDSPGPSGADATLTDTGATLSASGSLRANGAVGRSATPAFIGQYRVLGKLGEGGMGVVYEAEQRSPKRKVALKVVRGGQFVDDDRVRMFQREADTLARLKHPNIGAIYESGRTDEGQHFFAMELVRGETLDAYLTKRPAVVSQGELRHRLALFRKIADAVHYAHQRGVIHRDLKPSNVVVADEVARGDAEGRASGVRVPEVKILDFGLARITEGDIFAATMQTEIGVIKGTLPYMSPEQARGNPDEIDLRTDIYALGVILYEMLTGQRPYDLLQKTLVEAVRVICEEPPRQLRQSSRELRRFDPDIETIAQMALGKDADRRYASAAMLSEDVERYLTSQPILARPPSAFYQVKKFARRNRLLVGGLAALLAVLLAGVVASTWQARKATLEADKSQAVSGFLHEMFAAASPMSMTREDPDKGRDVTVMQILDDASRRLAGDALAGQPLVEAAVRGTLGATYRDLGNYEAAETNLVRSLQIREQILRSRHPEVAESLDSLALLRRAQGQFAEAEALLRRALAIRRQRLGDEHPATATTKYHLAELLEELDQLDESEALFRSALAVQRQSTPGPETARSLDDLAMLLQKKGEAAEAEEMLAEALSIRRRLLGDEHPEVARTLHNLAFILKARGDLAGTERVLREAVEIWRELLGDEHPHLASTLVNLSVVLQEQGRLADAEPLVREALAIQRRSLGNDNPGTGGALYNLAKLEQSQGKLADAELHYRQALEVLGPALPQDHPTLAAIRSRLGYVLTDLGRAAEAEPMLREALDVYTSTAPGRWYSAQVKSLLGAALAGQRRFREAEPLLLEGYAGLKDDPAVAPDRKRSALERIVRLYESWDASRPEAELNAKAAQWRTRLAAQEPADSN